MKVVEAPHHFTYNTYVWCKDIIKSATTHDTLVVDFINTVDMDTTALGMLLLLKDKFKKVDLINCNSDVLEVLKTANFKKLFSINKK